MNNKLKPKLLIPIILSIILSTAFISAPVSADDPMIVSGATPVGPTPPEHLRKITEFISEIRHVQNQVFDVAQFALNPETTDPRSLAPNISLIAHSIERIRQRILEYSTTIPSVGNQNRDVLLLLNALNFNKNRLNTISLLTATSTSVERIGLLDEFFRSRIAAKDTLNTIEELISHN